MQQSEFLAKECLRELPRRLAHVLAVGHSAVEISQQLPSLDRGVLVPAAFLHDVGYAPTLVDTGFHPIDGARWLASQGEQRIASLIANHSCARFEARERDLADTLAEFPIEDPEELAALTYCDLTTGPDGESVSLEERAEEILRRYDSDHPVARALQPGLPEFRAIVDRMTRQLDVAKTVS